MKEKGLQRLGCEIKCNAAAERAAGEMKHVVD